MGHTLQRRWPEKHTADRSSVALPLHEHIPLRPRERERERESKKFHALTNIFCPKFYQLPFIKIARQSCSLEESLSLCVCVFDRPSFHWESFYTRDDCSRRRTAICYLPDWGVALLLLKSENERERRKHRGHHHDMTACTALVIFGRTWVFILLNTRRFRVFNSIEQHTIFPFPPRTYQIGGGGVCLPRPACGGPAVCSLSSSQPSEEDVCLHTV